MYGIAFVLERPPSGREAESRDFRRLARPSSRIQCTVPFPERAARLCAVGCAGVSSLWVRSTRVFTFCRA